MIILILSIIIVKEVVVIKDFWNNLKFSWQFAKKYKRYLIGFVITSIFTTGISIVIPLLSAKIIINLTNN